MYSLPYESHSATWGPTCPLRSCAAESKEQKYFMEQMKSVHIVRCFQFRPWLLDGSVPPAGAAGGRWQ